MRNRRIVAWAVVCLSSAACNIETHEDDGWHGCETGGDAGAASTTDPAAGGSSAGSGGSTAGSGGSNAGSGGATAGGGGADTTDPPCESEADCERGFNCDPVAGKCTPTDHETCAELGSEASCTLRTDCVPIYAGIDCSCGTDCTCIGGEPGCVCERFDFFACEAGGG